MKYYKIIFFIIGVLLLTTSFAYAKECPAGEICNPLTSDKFEDLAAKVGEFLLDVGIVIAVLMVVVGGLQIMTAAGKSEQVTTGRKTIMWALIGLVVLLVAQGLVSLIKDILGVAP